MECNDYDETEIIYLVMAITWIYLTNFISLEGFLFS